MRKTGLPSRAFSPPEAAVNSLSASQAHISLETSYPRKWDDCALKADQTPIGLASVTSSRQGASDLHTNAFSMLSTINLPYGV